MSSICAQQKSATFKEYSVVTLYVGFPAVWVAGTVNIGCEITVRWHGTSPAWNGQFSGREKKPATILKAVANGGLWI